MTGNSPFDRFKAGDQNAMSESAQRGYQIFKDEKKGNCETCHVGFNFSDENYYNLGIGMRAKNPDLGYFAISKLEGHKGAFKTPTPREEVVIIYNKGGHPSRWLSKKIKPLNLSKQQQQDLVEFLKALSGEIT
jgi:cytochrome c peroxidase